MVRLWNVGKQTSLSPATVSSSSWGIPKPTLGLPWWLPPSGVYLKIIHGSILIWRPNHLSWLFNSEEQFYSELLTPSLRLSPATLRRKLVSSASYLRSCSFSHGHRRGLECRRTSKSKALPFSSAHPSPWQSPHYCRWSPNLLIHLLSSTNTC